MLEAAHELAIRKALALKAANAEDAGYIIPAPIYLKDKGDFWTQIDNLIVRGQKKIETDQIAFCAITLKKFEDSPAEGCADQPLVRLTYNFYFFRSYDYEREDETNNPDDFLKKTLKSYNAFISAILTARNEFLGLQELVGEDLPENFTVRSNSVTQPEFIEDLETCRFIPDTKGHSVDLQSVVEVLISDE